MEKYPDEMRSVPPRTPDEMIASAVALMRKVHFDMFQEAKAKNYVSVDLPIFDSVIDGFVTDEFGISNIVSHRIRDVPKNRLVSERRRIAAEMINRIMATICDEIGQKFDSFTVIYDSIKTPFTSRPPGRQGHTTNDFRPPTVPEEAYRGRVRVSIFQ